MTDKEIKLWDNYSNDNSAENRNALLEQYTGCIKVAILSITDNPDHFDDYFQYGCIAMMEKIIPTYDSSRGVKFTTYAIKQCRFYIMAATSKENKTIQKNKYKYKEFSLSLILNSNDSEVDILKSKEEDPLDIVVREESISKSFIAFTEEERQLILYRFWNGETFEKISSRVGRSKQAVEQHIKRILNKLKRRQ